MPHHRVELHRREAERTIAREQDHLAVGSRELGRHRVTGPRSQAAERAWIHPEARLLPLDQAARKGDEVAPVADDDRVGVGEAVHLGDEAGRVDRRSIGLRHRGVRPSARRFGLPKGLHPPAAVRLRTQRRRQLPDRRLEVAEDRDLARPVLAVIVDVEVDQPNVFPENRRLAEVEPEVEKHTRQDDQVCLAQRLASRAREIEGM